MDKAASELRLCVLNTENLFISLEHYAGEDLEQIPEKKWRSFALPQLRKKQKPLSKLWALSAAIQDINPDILMLIEVGGKESLENFLHFFLKDNYQPYFVETNSNRSIDLAFLIKKTVNMRAQTYSNRDFYKFSRDAAELHLYEEESLQLILFLTHLKSKISTDRDFEGRDIRRSEAEALVTLYKNTTQKYPDVPIIICGDLNSELASPELEELRLSGLTDFHDILGTEIEKRTSFVHFDYFGKAHLQTLDYILLSPHLLEKIIPQHSYTYRYKSFYDITYPLPKNPSQRHAMASDHFPLVVTLQWNNRLKV